MNANKRTKFESDQAESSKNGARPGMAERMLFPISVTIIAVYLVCFFCTPFEPYSKPGDPFYRGHFAVSVLFPEFYVSAWTGGGEESFAILDKFPQLLLAAICLFAAFGIGGTILRLVGIGDSATAASVDDPGAPPRFPTCMEFLLFSIMIGLGAYSTFFLVLGLFGGCGSSLASRCATGIGVVAGVCFLVPPLRSFRKLNGADTRPAGIFVTIANRFSTTHGRIKICCAIFAIPAIGTLLGPAVIPSNEYDVLSYHLQGAKEFYRAGHIGYVPHNVYMNMPLGAEMHALWGMTLVGDWKLGGLVGKVLIASFTLLTALGLWTFGRRFLDETTGAVAALLYLQMPWINEISGTGLIDCVLAAYLFFALYAVLACDGSSLAKGYFPVGFLAGCAAACKYPGLLYVVLPITVLAIYRNNNRSLRIGRFGFLLLGLFFGGAIWYWKNAACCNNPFYPLFDRFFPYTNDWPPATAARWAAAHASHDYSLHAFGTSLLQVMLTSPLLSPILAPLAAIGCFGLFAVRRNAPGNKMHDNRRILRTLVWYTLFIFACWWLFTHRLDRFWIPVAPLLALLAGFGTRVLISGTISRNRDDHEFVTKNNAAPASAEDGQGNRRKKRRRVFLYALLGFATVYTTLVNAAGMRGKNSACFAPVDGAYRIKSWVRYYNAHPPRGTLAVIGEADVYDYETPRLLYATCWNDPPLAKESFHDRDGMKYSYGVGIADPTATPEQVRERLHAQGISDILVHWGEIERFRGPDNYGFSDFPDPYRFPWLVRQGVLEPIPLDQQADEYKVRAYRVR